MSAPKLLYCHGFASSPSSRKAVALAARFEAEGLALERLDLRVPSFEHLRLGAMVARVREAIGGDDAKAIVLGSSLGGLTAARVAAIDPRVLAVVLLAPAFDLAHRWRARLGHAAFRAWEANDALVVDDLATRTKARVDFGFVRDLEEHDREHGVFPDVRVPALVIHGARDEVVPIEGSRAFVRGRASATLVEVDDDHELGASIPRIGDEALRFVAPWVARS